MIENTETISGPGADPNFNSDASTCSGREAMDLDGDGKISTWESNLCRLCLLGALAIAFGDKVINGMA